MNIINYYANTYGKLYRSCGNCSGNGCKRNVYIEGVTAVNGGELAGINSNYGDTATLKNVCADAKVKCQVRTASLPILKTILIGFYRCTLETTRVMSQRSPEFARDRSGYPLAMEIVDSWEEVAESCA